MPSPPSFSSTLGSRVRYGMARLMGRQGVRPRRYESVVQAVSECRAQRILEIGMYRGRRSLHMIEAAKRCYEATDIEYYGFDLFETSAPEVLASELSKTPLAMAQLQTMLDATGAKVRLFKGFSQETLPRFVEECLSKGMTLDLAFIDGGHQVDTIAQDWRNVSQLLRPGSVVMFDDYFSNTEAELECFGCQRVVDALDHTHYAVEVLGAEEYFRQASGLCLKIRVAKVTCLSLPTDKTTAA